MANFKNLPRQRDILFIGGIHDGKKLPIVGKLMETYTALTPNGNIVYNLMLIHLQGYQQKIYFYRQHGEPDLLELLISTYMTGTAAKQLPTLDRDISDVV